MQKEFLKRAFLSISVNVSFQHNRTLDPSESGFSTSQRWTITFPVRQGRMEISTKAL